MDDTFVERATVNDAPWIHAMSVEHIGGKLASAETIARVIRHNRNCIWLLKDRVDGRAVPAGFHANLYFTAEALARFQAGAFDPVDLDFGLLAAEGEMPVAVYFWATVAPRRARQLFEVMLRTEPEARFVHLPKLSRGATEAGTAALARFGFGQTQESAKMGAVGVASGEAMTKAIRSHGE